jgi:hypothetical protein
MHSRMGTARSHQAAGVRDSRSGKDRLAMNAFSGLGHHLDGERRPDGSFEAADIRGRMLCKGDSFQCE